MTMPEKTRLRLRVAELEGRLERAGLPTSGKATVEELKLAAQKCVKCGSRFGKLWWQGVPGVGDLCSGCHDEWLETMKKPVDQPYPCPDDCACFCPEPPTESDGEDLVICR
jgi:hypothetical protein